MRHMDQKGFSFIEVTLSVAVLGIITALAIPGYGAIQGDAKQAAVEASSNIGYTTAAAAIAGGEYSPVSELAKLNNSTIELSFLDATGKLAETPGADFCVQARNVQEKSHDYVAITGNCSVEGVQLPEVTPPTTTPVIDSEPAEAPPVEAPVAELPTEAKPAPEKVQEPTPEAAPASGEKVNESIEAKPNKSETKPVEVEKTINVAACDGATYSVESELQVTCKRENAAPNGGGYDSYTVEVTTKAEEHRAWSVGLDFSGTPAFREWSAWGGQIDGSHGNKSRTATISGVDRSWNGNPNDGANNKFIKAGVKRTFTVQVVKSAALTK